jgi:hypothetical protein
MIPGPNAAAWLLYYIFLFLASLFFSETIGMTSGSKVTRNLSSHVGITGSGSNSAATCGVKIDENRTT